MFWVTLACRNLFISIPRRFQHKKVFNKFPGRGQADGNLLDKWSYVQKVSYKSFLRILKVKCGQVPPAAVPKRHPRKVSAYVISRPPPPAPAAASGPCQNVRKVSNK